MNSKCAKSGTFKVISLSDTYLSLKLTSGRLGIDVCNKNEWISFANTILNETESKGPFLPMKVIVHMVDPES